MVVAEHLAITARPQSALRIIIPAAMLSVIALTCFAGPLVLQLPSSVGGSVLDAGQPLLAPDHLLGTDLNGNDVLSRLLQGGRLSLMIAMTANISGLLLGALLGAVSAYVGGVVDSVLMRILDAFIAFPSLVLVLAIAHAIESNLAGTTLALMSFTVPAFARVARASTLRLRERSFMLFAKLSRTPVWRVLLLHLGPNLLPQLVTFMCLGIGITIIVEGALSYLGLGVAPPAPSWGNMIYHGQQALATQPALVLLPSVCLFVTVLSCNLLGDALRERWITQ